MTNQLFDGDLFTLVDASGKTNFFQISYTGGDGNDVTLTVIPEPALMNLLMMLGAACWLRRRMQGSH